MFWFRDSRDEGGVHVDVAFTDASLDLRGLLPGFPGELSRLEAACGVRFARLSQVHGDEVLTIEEGSPPGEVPAADAMVTTRRGVGLMIRAADCVPLVLADPAAGVVGVVHAGRGGMALDVTTRAVEALERHGASRAATTAWLGPHVCGECYEVPAAMQEEACASLPEARAETRWGTPSVDIGRGVRTQLDRAGVRVVEVGGCTLEDQRLPSYRRDGADAGRLAGLVWLS